MIAKEVVLFLPMTEAVELRTRDLVKVYEGYSLCGSDIGRPLGLWFAHDFTFLIVGIPRRERHEDSIGTLLTDVSDITVQVMAIAIDGIIHLFA